LFGKSALCSTNNIAGTAEAMGWQKRRHHAGRLAFLAWQGGVSRHVGATLGSSWARAEPSWGIFGATSVHFRF
jgi:hypothetical protein